MKKKKEEKKPIDTRVLTLSIFIFTFTSISHLVLPGMVDLNTKKLLNDPKVKADVDYLLKAWGKINLIALFHGVAAIVCQPIDIAPFNVPFFTKPVLLTGNLILYIGGWSMGMGFANYLHALSLVGENEAQKRLTFAGMIGISIVLGLSLLFKFWGLINVLWDCCCGKKEVAEDEEEDEDKAAVGGDEETGDGGDGGGNGGD